MTHKMFVIKFVSFYFCAHIVYTNNIDVAVDIPTINSVTDMKSIAGCIVNVCRKDLPFRTTILRNSNKETEESAFFEEMAEAMYENNIQQVTFDTFQNLSEKIAVESADWLIVAYYRNCQALHEFDADIVIDKIKYLIIVSDHLTEDCLTGLNVIGNATNKFDVTFIFKTNEDHFKFLSFVPEIDENTCQEIVRGPKVINMCRKGHSKNISVFPSKNPVDMKKCAINVGMGPLYPYGIINKKEKYKTFDRLNITDVQGVDYELIKEIVNHFNGTLNLYYIFKKEENPIGQLDFIPLVRNGSLDVIAGGFYRIYGKVVAYSGVYSSQTVTWIYGAERPKKSWQNLIMKIDGLYIFVIFYVFYSCIWYLVSKYDNQAVGFRRTILYSWGALVGAASVLEAVTMRQKILNLVYLVMCIHLSAYISLHLYYFLTVLEPPALLKSNEDIMQSGRPVYLIPVSKFFVHDEKYIGFANKSGDCDQFQHCTEKCIKLNGITILIQGFFLNMQAKTAVNDEAKILRASENILTVYYEMLIRKNSPYVQRFPLLLMRLFEAGVPERFYSHAIGLTVTGKAHRASQNLVGSSYRCQSGCMITLEQFAGVFYLWLFGCVLSCCALVVELLWNYKSSKV